MGLGPLGVSVPLQCCYLARRQTDPDCPLSSVAVVELSERKVDSLILLVACTERILDFKHGKRKPTETTGIPVWHSGAGRLAGGHRLNSGGGCHITAERNPNGSPLWKNRHYIDTIEAASCS
ncbi:hypothetical protein J4Q44_G00090860 [Coregonus suidteri]|uniref:Uncharacterized protein n=1 Tax=Coregonus suidteri TaxID=861788 RepID=A0AAN8M0T9_9TELE